MSKSNGSAGLAQALTDTPDGTTLNAVTINIQAREGCKVDDDLRDHMSDKMRHVEKMWSSIDEAIVRLKCERGRFDAEVTLISGGMVARGEERAANPRAAFDASIAKIEAQLRRFKKKPMSRARRHDNHDNAAGTMIHPVLQNGTMPAPPAIEEEDESVVRVKRFALKPMAPEEAALQMEMLGHAFFVFQDDKSQQTSVVYRRKDGGYGLIEPVAD